MIPPMRILLVALGLFGLGLAAAEPPLTSPFTIQEKDGAIFIHERENLVLRYVRDPISSDDGLHSRGHYVHPLYSLNGTPMTEDMPADHPHHRGIFWAWSQLWLDEKLIGQPWEQKGLIWKVREVNQAINRDSASITCDVVWNSPLVNGGKNLVSEKATITVHRAASTYRRIDFRISLLALENGVRIGGSKNTKGYGGFSARIPMPDDMKIMGPDGPVEPNTSAPSEKSPWVDFSGSFDKSGRSGMTILCDTKNPGFPHGWTLRRKASCQNPVFPGEEPHALSMTKPLVLNYSLVLHSAEFGMTDLDQINDRYQSDMHALRSPANPVPPIHLPEAWIREIEAKLPKKLSAAPKQPRKVLLFSTATGYKP